jgi:phosphoglycerate dehydrogenase-like enzyme
MRVLIGPNAMGLEKCIPTLSSAYPQIEFAYCADGARLAAEIASAEVFFGWPSREVFLAAKKLQWIQSPSSGVDRFLAIPELAEGPVLLTSARGTHGGALGDSVMGMILAFTRGIVPSALAQREHHWARELRPAMVELEGTTMGLIGLGVVGRGIAQRAQGFGMRLIAVDAYNMSKPDSFAWVRGLEALPQLLAEADYVVITVPYTEQTRNMFAATQFGQMKRSAMLVGISRGGIIDEGALAEALRSEQIAAAALDVFSAEPLPADNPLWDAPNLLMTPHIAGGTQYEGRYLVEIFT